MRWIDIHIIAELLEEEYPSVDVVHIGFLELHRMVLGLEGFKDEPKRSNEKILEAIQAAWIEERAF